MIDLETQKYYKVYDFMVDDLKLKGTEKEVYAIIFSFYENGLAFNGSLSYLANRIGCSRQWICNSLNKLVEKQLLAVKSTYINGVKMNEYTVNTSRSTKLNTVQQSLTGVKESLTGVLKKVEYPVQQSLTNIKDNIKDNNKIYIKDTPIVPYDKNNDLAFKIKQMIDDFTANQNVKLAIYDYIDMRKKIKKPVTTVRTMNTVFKSLQKYGCTDLDYIDLLEQSIMNNWQGIFPIKKEKVQKEGESSNVFANYLINKQNDKR